MRRANAPVLSGVLSLVLAAAPVAASDSPWTALLPGGAQWQLGKKAEAVGWASATAGATVWGLSVRRGEGELNAPLLYAQQVWVTGIYAGYRDLRLRAADPGWPPPDPTSTRGLVAAPFKPSSLLDPWVFGPIVVGGGLGYLVARGESGRRSYSDLRRMRYLGATFSGREAALAGYTAYWIPISLGAGVAEEGLFRGMIQNDFERRWGSRGGLWAASALFGIAHVVPVDDEALGRVLFATAAGLYLGRLYQRTGYRLSKPIAAHFWWDAAVGLGIFLANPRENPLGAKVEFAF